ncbi:uncharacterized protein J3R85_011016 [Psidium guajava]|nr:uncharacterized protein J3R85_011016 [Psidium guajava]
MEDQSSRKRLRDDLLGFLDDSDPDPGAPDLDSLMRSFQDEIEAAPASSLPSPAAVEVVDLTAESGDSKSELGYLQEASDDELGLPPSTTPLSAEVASCEAELLRVASEAPGISEFWEFEDRIPGYGDSFQFGGGDGYGGGDEDGGYVSFDGLFDYSDAGFDPSHLPEFSWRRGETMPAL